MSDINQETRDIFMYGAAQKALNELSEYLGEPVKVEMSTKALKKWDSLKNEYDKFYKLSIEDRLIKSGMKAKLPTNQKESKEG